MKPNRLIPITIARDNDKLIAYHQSADAFIYTSGKDIGELYLNLNEALDLLIETDPEMLLITKEIRDRQIEKNAKNVIGTVYLPLYPPRNSDYFSLEKK